jgi:hypothetical protein
VLEELEWDPRLGSSTVAVGVAAHGVVTLTGVVKSYAEKVAAERAAKRVRGVRAVVNDIDVETRRELPTFLKLASRQPHDLASVEVAPSILAQPGGNDDRGTALQPHTGDGFAR